MNTFNYISVFPKTPAYQLGVKLQTKGDFKSSAWFKVYMARCEECREGRLKDQLLYIQRILQTKPVVHSLGENEHAAFVWFKKRNEQKGILP